MHRFSRCGCGAHCSVVMHERFAGVCLLTWLMVRPAPMTSAQPSLAAAQMPAHMERIADGGPADEAAASEAESSGTEGGAEDAAVETAEGGEASDADAAPAADNADEPVAGATTPDADESD